MLLLHFLWGIMREGQYQRKLIDRLETLFPGCIILRNDPKHIQGFPDLTILYQGYWAALEVKASADAPVRANQPHYVERLDAMSFAAFIYPENEEVVLSELQRSFTSNRKARLS